MAGPILGFVQFSSGDPAIEIKYLRGFVSQKSLVPPSQIDVESRRYVFALTLALQTLQLVHVSGPILQGLYTAAAGDIYDLNPFATKEEANETPADCCISCRCSGFR